jgi:hypothetical protein
VTARRRGQPAALPPRAADPAATAAAASAQGTQLVVASPPAPESGMRAGGVTVVDPQVGDRGPGRQGQGPMSARSLLAGRQCAGPQPGPAPRRARGAPTPCAHRLRALAPGRQSLAALCHVLRLLKQAASDGCPVPWVLIELVSGARAPPPRGAGSSAAPAQDQLPPPSAARPPRRPRSALPAPSPPPRRASSTPACRSSPALQPTSRPSATAPGRSEPCAPRGLARRWRRAACTCSRRATATRATCCWRRFGGAEAGGAGRGCAEARQGTAGRPPAVGRKRPSLALPTGLPRDANRTPPPLSPRPQGKWACGGACLKRGVMCWECYRRAPRPVAGLFPPLPRPASARLTRTGPRAPRAGL